jgi:hypothetical protein
MGNWAECIDIAKSSERSATKAEQTLLRVSSIPEQNNNTHLSRSPFKDIKDPSPSISALYVGGHAPCFLLGRQTSYEQGFI